MTFAGFSPTSDSLIQPQPNPPVPRGPDHGHGLAPPPEPMSACAHARTVTRWKRACGYFIASLILLVLAQAPAHATAVCSDTPASGERIECVEEANSTIDINAVDIDIDTSADDEPGVKASHEGTADVEIDVSATGADAPSTIDTTGADAHGLHAEYTGTGDIIINIENTGITTTGDSSHGVHAKHTGDGDIDIEVVDGSNIDIQGAGNEYAVRAAHDGDGDIVVFLEDATTNNTIRIEHHGVGTSTVRVMDSTITSDQVNGIVNVHSHTSSDPRKTGRTDSSTYVTNTDITLSGESGGTNNFGAVYGDVSSNSDVGDVLVDVEDSKIVTTGARAFGVRGRNLAKVGDIRVNVRNSTIESVSTGIRADRNATGRGAVYVDVQDTTVTTTGDHAYGIHTLNASEDATASDVQELAVEDSTITTKGLEAHGILNYRDGDGDIVIDARNVDIVTESTALGTYGDTFTHGIWARHKGLGDIDIDLQGGTTDTKGAYSYGVYGLLEKDTNGGTISIETGDGHAITTTGVNGHGVVAYHYGTSEEASLISIDMGGSIDVSGAGAQGVRVGVVNNDGAPERVAAIGTDGYRRQTVTVDGSITSAAEGVSLAGGGRVIIGSQGSIESGSGIAILATGNTPVLDENGDPTNETLAPKLRIDFNLGGRQVADALGDNWIINDGGETTIAVNDTVLHEGATGIVADAVAHNGVWNVSMRAEGVTVTDRTDPDPANWLISDPAAGIILDRDFSVADFNELRRPPPAPPTPPPAAAPVPAVQEYTVADPVVAAPDATAGVHVKGDGMVHIGSTGTISSYSGIAILATQEEPDNSGTQGQAFVGDIGGVELNSAGAVSQIAPLLSADGPKLIVDMDLDGRSVQDVIGDDWIINDGGETTIIINGVTLHEGATGIIPDALAPNGPFNVALTGEGVTVMDRTDPDPANWLISDPTLGVIADRDFSTKDFLYLLPSGTAPLFVEEYAPRAAVYEALPGFLLRLGTGGPLAKHTASPEAPVWVRVSGGRGSYEADRASVGAEYDYDHTSVAAGKDLALGEHATGMVSMHHVSGSADISSPMKGGEIDAEGIGLAVGISVTGASAYYASGGFSLTRYDLDLFSDDLGRLKADVEARTHTLDLEVGKRMTTRAGVTLAPRVRLRHSKADVEDFTDTVDAQVSGIDADRITASFGMAAETAQARPWWGGTVSLGGSVDLARTLGGMDTRIDVSGEALSSQPIRTRLLFDLGGTYRRGHLSFGAEITASGLGSDDEHYAGHIALGRHF